MEETCEGYTYALAIVDVLPIVAFAAAFWFLVQVFAGQELVIRRATQVAAVLLVVGATIAGPGRKAVIAGQGAGECDLHKEFQLPFFLPMPLAFMLLAWAAVCLLKGRRVNPVPFAAVVLLVWVGAAVAGKAMISLAGAGLIAVFFAVVMALVARDRGDLTASVLFVLYAVGTLALPALASSSDSTDASHQWLEQGTNAITMIALALACYRLRNAVQRSGDRPVLVGK
jgi:hypothetical protein